ncbi:MAG TPA: PEGA domain-containing protein [Anaeromyxobacter sp.]|nr:PEGA domain-containing protein [Anaeromyxobacter sp.]
MSVVRLAVVSAAIALVACAGGKAGPPPSASAAPAAAAVVETPAPVAATPAAPPATGLELRVEPPSAEVLVDGEARGVVSDLASGVLGLAPGIYQVSLQAAGYVTWRAEVAVRSGRERIEVRLARKEPAAR